MNKKQLLEAVELLRATHTPDELADMDFRLWRERGCCRPTGWPIHHHIVNIASLHGRTVLRPVFGSLYVAGNFEQGVHDALADHHPNQFVRWWYRHLRYVRGLLVGVRM